ncbi:CYTH domain-containing protein [Spirosoma arcticum]
MSDQSETIYKFTQKIQTDIFGQCVITNIYLSESEYNMFQNLDSWQLTKTRYYYRTEYLTIAIDDFNEDNLLAEIEFHNDQEMNDFIMPIPFIEEVTNQLCFTGWELSQKYGKRSTAIFDI